MTETPQNRHEVDQLRALLSDLGVTGDDFAVRPLARRGFAAGESTAIEVDEAVIAPELTVTADGVHGHPIGGDLASSPDLLVAAGEIPLAQAKQLIVERFLSLRQADGTPPSGIPVRGMASILIMARASRAGEVKTRLEPRLGPEGCAWLQAELIRHTAAWTSDGPVG